MLHTYGLRRYWRIVFSTFRRCMSFYTARVRLGRRVVVVTSRLYPSEQTWRLPSAGLPRAKTGCEQSQQGSPYSITSVLRSSMDVGTSVHSLGREDDRNLPRQTNKRQQ